MPKALPVMRGRKFIQVLEGARTVFLRDGFEGASVDDIAREAGVSKATLYSYFPDKRIMFTEVFRNELAREVADVSALVDVELPVHQVLPFIVQIISSHFVSDFRLRIFRISVAEAERFPELAREFYDAGPSLLRQQLMRYLGRCVARGELKIDDLELAADQLIELARARVHDQALFLGKAAIEGEMLRKINRAAVDMFLGCYAANRDCMTQAAE